jgi:Cu/Ag efflux protein CusF
MRKNLRFLMAVAALLAMVFGPWGVQAQQSMPGVQGSPSASAATSFEGTVKKVNPAARTLEVSIGLLGLWGKTLEVTDGTQIQSEGRQATLEDIREGTKVKASYETRAGKSIATRIDLLPVPQPKEAPGQTMPKTQ